MWLSLRISTYVRAFQLMVTGIGSGKNQVCFTWKNVTIIASVEWMEISWSVEIFATTISRYFQYKTKFNLSLSSRGFFPVTQELRKYGGKSQTSKCGGWRCGWWRNMGKKGCKNHSIWINTNINVYTKRYLPLQMNDAFPQQKWENNALQQWTRLSFFSVQSKLQTLPMIISMKMGALHIVLMYVRVYVRMGGSGGGFM